MRTYVYASPDIKTPPLALLSLNALLSGAGEEGRFLALQSGGFVIAEHVRKLDEPARDFVDVALGFRGTPYLWGGRTSLGVDCSGLVQLASEAAGLSCPRDADMQANEVGRQLDWQGPDALARGDLVFWDGHVGIMTGAQDLVHASAYQMMVVEEPLAEATRAYRLFERRRDYRRAAPRWPVGSRAHIFALVQHAEQPKQNDDGDRDADQPEENAAHGERSFVRWASMVLGLET